MTLHKCTRLAKKDQETAFVFGGIDNIILEQTAPTRAEYP